LRKTMMRCLGIFLCVFLLSCAALAEDAAGRAESAADVLNQIMAAPDKGIPEEILGSAKCVAVVPRLLKGGFVFGGAHGRGMATCHTVDGWSAPAPFSINGGSFGLQIGLQGVDLVMLIMNERGMQALLSSQFKLGADASAAAGPVGRHAEAATDWTLHSEVLTYSRARGLFAGLTINGAVIRQDEDSTRELYGRMVPFKSILTGAVPAPQGGEPFVAAVRKATENATGTAAPPHKSNVPVNPPATGSAPPPANAPAPTPAPSAPASEPSPSGNQTSPSPTPPPTSIARVDRRIFMRAART
jgi:SH3 domain-containing YSC84-like protein 1